MCVWSSNPQSSGRTPVFAHGIISPMLWGERGVTHTWIPSPYFILSCKEFRIRIRDFLRGAVMCSRGWKTTLEFTGRAVRRSHTTPGCCLQVFVSLVSASVSTMKSPVFAHRFQLLEVNFAESFHSC